MKYRPEIDGLRTIAVLPVILFHGGVPGFGGGYVGVDVFFVISGFLITGIIAEDLARGRFSLIDFYERRARRILPALFVVIAACIPFAWAWLVPGDFVDFAQSVLSTVSFWSNILFWRESGYFGTAAEMKPLLHTWSLSVEEQFYVFFPLILWGLWRFGLRITYVVLALGLFGSLIIAQWGAMHAPSAAYFLLPTRAWELMIGSLAALAVRSGRIRLPHGIEETLGLAGLAMIAYSVTVFDKNTAFPGLPALVPTLGALFILLPAQSNTLVHRLLSLRVMVGLGLVSYSAYLWHQPLFAFARHQSLGHPSGTVIASLVLGSFVLAYLTWQFVEAPFRNRSRMSRGAVFGGSAVAGAALCAFGVAGWTNDGFPQRLNIPASIEASIERSSREAECFGIENFHEISDWTCQLGAKDASPQFFVFGDSHALSLLDSFDAAARELGFAGEFSAAAGCLPFLGIHAIRNDQETWNCNAANARLLEYVQQKNITNVILISRWAYYTDGNYSGNEGGLSFVARTPDHPKDRAESRAAFEQGLVETLNAYKNAGISLTLIAQVPQQLVDPMQVFRRAFSPWSNPADTIAELSITRERHAQLQGFADMVFDRHNAPIVDFGDILCEANRCPIGTLDTSFYIDDDHLSLSGANRLTPAIKLLLSGF